MRVLVFTGGAGYVGLQPRSRSLSKATSARPRTGGTTAGLAPVRLEHPKFSFLRGDIVEAPVVRRADRGIEAVVHLAAILAIRPARGTRSGRVGSNRSFRISSGRRAQWVSVASLFASTCKNYGRMKDPEALVSEDSELSPVSSTRTKVAFERMLLDDSATNGSLHHASALRDGLRGLPRMRFDLTVNEVHAGDGGPGRLTVYGEQFWTVHPRAGRGGGDRSGACGAGAVVRHRVLTWAIPDKTFASRTWSSLFVRRPRMRSWTTSRSRRTPRLPVSLRAHPKRARVRHHPTRPGRHREVARLVRDGVIANPEDP